MQPLIRLQVLFLFISHVFAFPCFFFVFQPSLNLFADVRQTQPNCLTIQNRYVRNRLYRMKQYIMLEQAAISITDFNALVVATVKSLNRYETYYF